MRYFAFLSFLLSLSFVALLQAKKSNWSWPPKAKPVSVDLSKFSLDPNLEITLWAKSPMFYNPTNMAIDPQGRIWIAEGVNYREKLGIRREAGHRHRCQSTPRCGRLRPGVFIYAYHYEMFY